MASWKHWCYLLKCFATARLLLRRCWEQTTDLCCFPSQCFPAFQRGLVCRVLERTVSKVAGDSSSMLHWRCSIANELPGLSYAWCVEAGLENTTLFKSACRLPLSINVINEMVVLQLMMSSVVWISHWALNCWQWAFQCPAVGVCKRAWLGGKEIYKTLWNTVNGLRRKKNPVKIYAEYFFPLWSLSPFTHKQEKLFFFPL